MGPTRSSTPTAGRWCAAEGTQVRRPRALQGRSPPPAGQSPRTGGFPPSHLGSQTRRKRGWFLGDPGAKPPFTPRPQSRRRPLICCSGRRSRWTHASCTFPTCVLGRSTWVNISTFLSDCLSSSLLLLTRLPHAPGSCPRSFAPREQAWGQIRSSTPVLTTF